ncbi:uncharacterized protein LOC112568281 [Pomacea canaliculata]|uniref:uncharacterized protein LOC112568281 n=1 Tax=Pomacea canaliculata TaxID=400727 RepID=UPI000D73988E|nr:uncharacterized protein LOC112568281 [Pomacea canaliculata]
MEISNDFVGVLSDFMRNGVHGQTWPKNVSYAVAQYKEGKETRYFRAKNDYAHAEEAVIKHFENLMCLDELVSDDIKVYISNSPCFSCSDKIINFLKNAKRYYKRNLKVELVFSAFYRVRRPSCEENPRCIGRLPDEDAHKAQVEGLKNLFTTPGIVLRPFTKQDWMELQIALSCRQDEDEKLRKDFEQLMSLKSTLSTSVHSSECAQKKH